VKHLEGIEPTFSVADLIKELIKYPRNLPVVLKVHDRSRIGDAADPSYSIADSVKGKSDCGKTVVVLYNR
jgi:hypothetical protein